MEYQQETKDTTWAFAPTAGVPSASLIGYEAIATDGSIGEITEESVSVGSAHIVVDAGSWLFDKLRLVPAGAVARVDHENKCAYVSMSKAEIKNAPDYVAQSDVDTDDNYRLDHERYFAPWVGGIR